MLSIAASVDLPLFKSTDIKILPCGSTTAVFGRTYWNTLAESLEDTRNVPLYMVGFAP